jgi:glucose/arabinose dehydrogenase
VLAGIAALALLGPAGAPPPAPERAIAATLPPGFQESIVFSGLTNPTVVRFASDGRVFVAEKSGLIKVFDNLSDTTPTVFADLRTNVYNFWDRGLLGLALDLNFPTTPYVYVLYAYDHILGDPNPAPKWGTAGATSDPCPTPPGPTTNGCVVSARLSRLQASGNLMTGSEQVLVEDWCQQFPSHSIGDLESGPDGALYVSAGEGASFTFADYGQTGTPLNPCGDPPGGAGATLTPPTAEGGALRAQDLRTTGDPVGLSGAVLRVDPATGAGLPSNPLAGSADANARRIIAYGLRNPFRFTFRPGTNEMWVGDVGWSDWEEINRISDPADSVVENFGWPCYEGPNRQAGYDSSNLNICENLYAQPSADTKPYFSYQHTGQVVSGESCPTGSSSISGLSFAFSGASSPYPSDYDNALFFADYSRDCIWVMKKDPNGVPAPGLVQTFVAGAANPVDVERGPAGEIYYVDFDGGTIRRIVNTGQPTSCPRGQYLAQYYSNKTLSGSAAVSQCETGLDHDWGNGAPIIGVPSDNFSVRWTGQFDFGGGPTDFTATSDDGIRVWIDGQILIDRWTDQGATTVTATRSLTAGTHEVKVEYYDSCCSALARVSWVGGPGTCSDGQYQADYFANKTLSGTPVLTRCEAAIDNDWGSGGPGSGVPNDNFSARWAGRFNFGAGTATFTTTADDGIRLLVDNQILIDNWVDQGATTKIATKTMTAGLHDIRVEYYDSCCSAIAKASWTVAGTNTPPTPNIATPAQGTTWKVGDTISFSGSATDTEDGTLSASALSWTLLLQHCPSTCHTHTIQTWQGVATGSFTAPDHDYPSYLELQLTATDSAGQAATVTRRLDPVTVNLTFASSPAGLQLNVDGTNGTAPFTRTVIVGSSNSVSATSPQTLSGTTFTFSSWSDGGAQTHNIVAPASAATYTATYQSAASAPVNTGLPNISGPAREGRQLSVSNGTWTGSTPMTFTYQWSRCDSNGNVCAPISGATGNVYSLTASDVGSRMRAAVNATNGAGSATATSAATAVVKGGR